MKETKFQGLTITKPVNITANPEALKTVNLREGFTFPESYQDFAENFGYGLLCNLFIIYIPKEGGDNLKDRYVTLSGVIKEGIDEEYFEYEPDGSEELVQNLIPFGISENGDILAWNQCERSSADEYYIYLIGYKLGSVRKVATNLYGFVEQCVDKSAEKFLGAAIALVQPTFSPYDKPIQ